MSGAAHQATTWKTEITRRRFDHGYDVRIERDRWSRCHGFGHGLDGFRRRRPAYDLPHGLLGGIEDGGVPVPQVDREFC